MSAPGLPSATESEPGPPEIAGASPVPRLVCFPLQVPTRVLRRYQRVLDLPDPGAALTALARAVASSPAWEAAPEAALMVRRRPEPLLAVMGRFDHGQQAWVGVQARHLESSCERLRYVGYARAEKDCQRLAARLTGRFGHDQIRSARFAAIPRGGLIPLSLLAVMLGLDAEQLGPPQPSDSILVVVDDCVLSGARFRELLAAYDHRRIVFAPLYSHPEARAAIESAEPRVLACVSARDLDAGEEARHADLRRSFLEHMHGAYWIGDTEPLGFAWGEPDRLIWHPGEGRPVPSWRVVPPELAVKNRTRRPIPITVQPEAAGPLRPARQVIFGELAERIVLHHLDRGQSAALDAVASDVWKGVVRHGHLAAVVEELSRVYPVSEETLQRDAAGFVEQLIEREFLEPG